MVADRVAGVSHRSMAVLVLSLLLPVVFAVPRSPLRGEM